jgi:hypothetical protein
MAADAFARGDRLRAELFVAAANRSADEAQTMVQQQQQPRQDRDGE